MGSCRSLMGRKASVLAEQEGFEPSIRENRIPDFECEQLYDNYAGSRANPRGRQRAYSAGSARNAGVRAVFDPTGVAVNHPLEWGAYIIRPEDRKHTNTREASNGPGIYAWYTADQDLIYVGQSVHIATRLFQHQTGTFFWLGVPSYFSFREVPLQYLDAVEAAHIRVLAPYENKSWGRGSCEFGAELSAAIQQAWADVRPAQHDRIDAISDRMSEELAEKINRRRFA